ncbi:hypothetical protein [Chelatococcus reniformis]|uniref:DUF2188 domain-containing protein n=1 Tax=Chelatococcus reniformis TaxID=1494448 RepID=A0A916UFM8_9HYPH|nr:hypothetical protein [Chelatococcus reniformis]GGC70267.1 hypothetical protein GCM10010994_31060 [Chelatococcus reniformis]
MTTLHLRHDDIEPPSRAISFVVGRDAEGHWIAAETEGRAGGLFSDREAALRYAAFETGHRRGAVALVANPIKLRL